MIPSPTASALLADPRDRAALLRVAELSGWAPRRAYRQASGTVASGQGLAFARSGARAARIAMALTIDVDLRSGEVKLRG